MGLLGALGLSAAPAPAASTHSGDVSAFSFQPAATTAGGSANLNADLKFGSDTPKSVELDWPAGLWASLKTAPAGTQIGSGSLTLTGLGLLPLSATATLAMSSSIPAGAPAACSTTTPAGNCTLSGLQLNATALGQTITAPGYVVLNPSTASLQIVFPSIPNTAIGLPITLTELKLTLNASTANGQFIRLPSNTGTDTTTVKVTGYGGATGTGTDSFTPSGSPAFSPGVAAATANVNAAQQAQVIIDIQQPGGQAGATTHSLVIPGSILNVSGGAIADLCGPPNPAGNCDGETITTPVKVGSVALTTPLLPTPVPGDFWLSGSVSAPVVTVAFPALGGLSFSGKIDPSTIGTNPTVNFTGIPDVPFTDLKVTMDASSTGLFNAACIPASGPSSDPLNWSFTSWWSAAPPVSSSTPFTVNGTVNDCPAGGSSGPDPVTGINNPDPGTGPTYTDTTTTPTTTG
ncbi:MAG: hypothetical protein J2O48_07190, partial [Solirubrobacterales bacterium]|nr:hypothetical protein [Solirubrobacterales bacterium]